MFKYISEILSHFTKTQRIMALLMLLTTITIISIGPSLIDSITTDRKELELKITNQSNRIKILENQIDTLDAKIRESQRSCTQEIYAREGEFIQMLDEIRAEAFNYKVSTRKETKLMLKTKNVDENGNEMMMMLPPEENNSKPDIKVDISPILSKIDNMKKKIKH